MKPPETQPDTHALNIARAVQERVAPAPVILFGSRAVGDYRDDSDVDLLVIGAGKSRGVAEQAAREYTSRHSLPLEVNIVSMEPGEFSRNRKAKQHLAGQAEHHGVLMSEYLLPDSHGEQHDQYPIHWPATRKRLENAAEWLRAFNDMVDEGYWNQKILGFAAQQSVENALKGWLSTFNDPARFGHDLNGLWRRLESIQDWSLPNAGQLREALTSLFQYTRYESPENPGTEKNWLTEYASVYRYDMNPRPMRREEKLELKGLVNRAVAQLAKTIHQVSGTSEVDIFPDGRPWEQ